MNYLTLLTIGYFAGLIGPSLVVNLFVSLSLPCITYLGSTILSQLSKEKKELTVESFELLDFSSEREG